MTDLPVKGCRTIELQVMGDDRGSLIAIESATGLPFSIARAYFIFATRAGVARGFHAHRNLRQWAVCVSGACSVLVEDGGNCCTVRLDRPSLALEIGPMIWREMHDFTDDAVLLVLADKPYTPDDYIRERDAFFTMTTANSK